MGEKVITNCVFRLQPYLQEVMCSMGVASDTFCPIKVGQGVDATFKLVEVLVLLPALRKKDSIVLDDEKVVSFPTPIPHIESVIPNCVCVSCTLWRS